MRLDDRFDETQAEAETPPRAALSPRPVWFREVERTSLSRPSRRAVVGHGAIRWRDTRSLDPRELRCRVALVMQTPVMLEGTVRDNLCIGPAAVRGDFSEERLGGTLKETISICAANHALSLLTDERYGASGILS
jgi:hypothetical protein